MPTSLVPPTLDGMALGLIETRGYAGLIVASDVAVKAAGVQITSVERATGGLVLITMVGDVASVQVAVAAGAEKAAAVGCLISSHVIPRPDAGVWRLLGLQEQSPQAVSPRAKESLPTAQKDELEGMPVRQLRRKARSLPGIKLTGREISSASKKELLAAIREASGSGTRA